MVQQNMQHQCKAGIDFSLSPNTKIPLCKKILKGEKTLTA
jgi:hypothetical protein